MRRRDGGSDGRITDTTISKKIIEHLSRDSPCASTLVFDLEQGMPFLCFAWHFEDAEHVVDVLIAELLKSSAHSWKFQKRELVFITNVLCIF